MKTNDGSPASTALIAETPQPPPLISEANEFSKCDARHPHVPFGQRLDGSRKIGKLLREKCNDYMMIPQD